MKTQPRTVNVGPINLDPVDEVDPFVRPGESLAGSGYEVHAGGKGFNQPLALARAGVSVSHVGKFGRDGA